MTLDELKKDLAGVTLKNTDGSNMTSEQIHEYYLSHLMCENKRNIEPIRVHCSKEDILALGVKPLKNILDKIK